MAEKSALVFDIASVQAGDLQASPNPDGSEFKDKQIIEFQPGCVRLILDIYGKAVSSLNPVFVLYRWQSKLNAFCKANEITLDTAITNTTTGEYRALEPIEIGNGKWAIALKDAETGSTLKVVWTRSSIQGV